MKRIVKIFGVLGVLLIGLSTFVSAGINVDASETNDFLVKQQETEINIIQNNLATHKDSKGNRLVYIIDKSDLKSSLDRINSEITISEIQQYLNEFNRTIQKENGHGWLTDKLHEVENYMKNQNINSKTGERSACSWAFTGAGLLHSGIYTAAALGLSLTGVGAAVIPFAVGAAYGIAGAAIC